MQKNTEGVGFQRTNGWQRTINVYIEALEVCPRVSKCI